MVQGGGSNAQRYDVRCSNLQSEIHVSTSKMECLFAEGMTSLSREKPAQSEAMELLSAKLNVVDAKYEKVCALLSIDLRNVKDKFRDDVAAHAPKTQNECGRWAGGPMRFLSGRS